MSGCKSLRHRLVLRLLGERVALYPLTKTEWYEATQVAQLPLIRNNQIEPLKQYASILFLMPELIGLLMDLDVPKGGFRNMSEFTSHRGGVTPLPRASVPTTHPFT